MRKRSVIDTEPELNARATDLAIRLGLPPNAFLLHQIKRAFIDYGATMKERTHEIVDAGFERDFTTAEPVPAGNGAVRAPPD